MGMSVSSAFHSVIGIAYSAFYYDILVVVDSRSRLDDLGKTSQLVT